MPSGSFSKEELFVRKGSLNGYPIVLIFYIEQEIIRLNEFRKYISHYLLCTDLTRCRYQFDLKVLLFCVLYIIFRQVLYTDIQILSGLMNRPYACAVAMASLNLGS